MKRLIKSERGTALLETAITLPLVLLVSIGIFEFGRAYQTKQILTNAAREGARLAVTPGTTKPMVEERIKAYLKAGQVGAEDSITVSMTPDVEIDIGGGNTALGTNVTVDYPFSFMLLNGVAKMVVKGATVGGAFTMSASAEMRNE